MKVLVKHFLNVRVGRPSVNAPSFQYLAPGSELEVDARLYKGDSFEGIDTWLKDAANNYYWSGGVNLVIDSEELLKNSNPIGVDKKIFGWFKKMSIDTIWNTYHEKGSDVTIAVLDTGYDKGLGDVNRGIVKSKILIDASHYPGIEMIDDDQSNDRHGTRCASIIGARNNLAWLVGIAPECKLLTGKISINREVRSFDFIFNAVDWAIKEGAEVISISYAVDLRLEDVESLNKRFQQIIKNKNVLIVASAGNSGSQQQVAEMYPASFDNCISVGAVDEHGLLSPITILSDKTILHAPGINIESFGKDSIPDPQSGTSFSTPIVAAIAGLAISYMKKKNNNIWNSVALIDHLYQTADAIVGHPSKKVINAVSLFNKLKNQ